MITSSRSTFSSSQLESIFGGCIKYLESAPMVCDIRLSTRSPVPASHLTQFQKDFPHCVLPADLLGFLEMTDGLLLSWSVKTPNVPCKIAKLQKNDPVIQVGVIQINQLEKIQVFGVLQNEIKADMGKIGGVEAYEDFQGYERPPGCLFLIQECKGIGKVYLRIFGPFSHVVKPDIWFHDDSNPQNNSSNLLKSWYYISSSFTDYWRLMVAHLGILGWQLGYTERGMPVSTLDWLSFYSPDRAKMWRKQRAKILGAPKIFDDGVRVYRQLFEKQLGIIIDRSKKKMQDCKNNELDNESDSIFNMDEFLKVISPQKVTFNPKAPEESAMKLNTTPPQTPPLKKSTNERSLSFKRGSSAYFRRKF
ncbi:Tubulin polyglutamylase complex subunit 2 [Nowakowskiella sp. JEL0407]|nr:Tubulin polyglutamylase complex subunit 2 [Nowakowskiella sp. JEL0407]